MGVKIVFVAEFGAEGQVREDLRLDYMGRLRGDVETNVEAQESEGAAKGRSPPHGVDARTLLLEHPDRVPLFEMDRRA